MFFNMAVAYRIFKRVLDFVELVSGKDDDFALKWQTAALQKASGSFIEEK